MQVNYQNHSPEVQLELVSTTTSDLESKPKPRPETIGPKSTDSNIVGNHWEKEVARTARIKGYEVFPNDVPKGPVDLVLGINGEYYPFDVKQECWCPRDGIWYAKNCARVADGVWAICVNPETGRVRWPLSNGGDRKTPKCPPGCENIWD